jgi:hypothetical protein
MTPAWTGSIPPAGRGGGRGRAGATARWHRARPRRGLPGVALGLAVLVAAGCTGPVRSDGVYASKAASSARAAASAVQTAQLAVQQAVDGKLFGRTLAQTLAELRIAARRGDVAELPKLAAPLPQLGVKLQRFQEAHQ